MQIRPDLLDIRYTRGCRGTVCRNVSQSADQVAIGQQLGSTKGGGITDKNYIPLANCPQWHAVTIELQTVQLYSTPNSIAIAYPVGRRARGPAANVAVVEQQDPVSSQKMGSMLMREPRIVLRGLT